VSISKGVASWKRTPSSNSESLGYCEHCGKADKRWVLVGHRPDSVGVTPHPCCRAETRQSTHDGLHGATVFGCLQVSTPKTRARVHMRMYVRAHVFVSAEVSSSTKSCHLAAERYQEGCLHHIGRLWPGIWHLAVE
jgi:hypothetical protein